MLPAILLASLISLFAIAHASAQTPPASNDSFGGLGGGKTIIIVDDGGVETIGRVRLLTADALTISVAGRERTFARRQVSAIFEPGDSLKNGATIGLFSGALLGFAAGTQSTCGDFWTGLHSCSFNEKMGNGAFAATLLGGIGAALGAGLDAIIPGRTALYRRPSSRALIVAPVLAPAHGSVGVGVSW